MKKSLSKIRKKSSKGSPQNNVMSKSENIQTNLTTGGQLTNHGNEKFYIYNVSHEPMDNRKRKSQNDLSPGKSSTTYEPFTSSTSESDPVSSGRRNDKVAMDKNEKRNSGVCITLPEGKGNIRIVGNVSGPRVVFAPLDAVYGALPEASSDEEEDDDDRQYDNKKTQVYRFEDIGNQIFSRESKENGPSSPPVINEGDSKQNNETRRQNNVIVSGGMADVFGQAPTLAMPLISVNIDSSKEDIPEQIPNVTTKRTSSRLIRLKQHLFESGVAGKMENNSPESDMRSRLNRGNGHKVPGYMEENSGQQVYYVGEGGINARDLQGVLEQLVSHHNNGSSETGSNRNPGAKLENIGSKQNADEAFKPEDSGLMRPVIYIATTKKNDILIPENLNDRDSTELKKTVDITASLKKNPSKHSAKKKIEVIGSKIGLRKSKRSFIRSSIPKPSVTSSRKLTMSGRKINQNPEENISRESKKYVIRDVMIIPEDQIGPKYADEIPEESVMYAEREIRQYDLNNGGLKTHFNENDKSGTIQTFALEQIKLDQANRAGSIPCLYYCSTSRVDDECENKDSNVNANATNETRGDRNPPSSSSHQDKDPNKDQDNQANTIVIDSVTRREIMKAIESFNGKERIISLPTNVSNTGKHMSIGANKSKGGKTISNQTSVAETIKEEDVRDQMKDYSHKRNTESNYETDATDNTETDHSKLNQNGRRVILKTPQQPQLNYNHQFTAEPLNSNATGVLTYTTMVRGDTPMSAGNNKNSLNNPQKNKQKSENNKIQSLDRNKNKSRVNTILSFSEPVIQESPLFDSEALENFPVILDEKSFQGEKQKKNSNKKNLQVPETMVYVGRLPNTTYNVFFAPDSSSPGNEGNVETGTLDPVKSEKQPTQGPKAILIFVNKKTELNRNPFDGNVMYDDDDDGKGRRDNQGRGRSDRDRDKRASGDSKTRPGRGGRSGKARRSGVSGKSGRSGRSGRSGKTSRYKGKSRGGPDSRFDVSSVQDPGRSENVVVEKSPSGLKTVVKYPCGCMKITKIDPEDDSVTEEITSAFCRLGSKCEVNQSQKNKRKFTYPSQSGDTRRGESGYYKSSKAPCKPHLDIVLQGLLSKKPIKAEPAAPSMNGASLTGTLTIKTNKCNGVLNVYLDPRIKQCFRGKFPCCTNDSDMYSTNRSNQVSYSTNRSNQVYSTNRSNQVYSTNRSNQVYSTNRSNQVSNSTNRSLN